MFLMLFTTIAACNTSPNNNTATELSTTESDAKAVELGLAKEDARGHCKISGNTQQVLGMAQKCVASSAKCNAFHRDNATKRQRRGNAQTRCIRLQTCDESSNFCGSLDCRGTPVTPPLNNPQKRYDAGHADCRLTPSTPHRCQSYARFDCKCNCN